MSDSNDIPKTTPGKSGASQTTAPDHTRQDEYLTYDEGESATEPTIPMRGITPDWENYYHHIGTTQPESKIRFDEEEVENKKKMSEPKIMKDSYFTIKPEQKNMNYKTLWEKLFAKYSNILPWNQSTCLEAKPFQLYSLRACGMPTVKSLYLRKPCLRNLPITRNFNDNVLISVTFKSSKSSIFCAYTTSFNGQMLFCLWERFPSGISDTLNNDIFDQSYLLATQLSLACNISEDTYSQTSVSVSSVGDESNANVCDKSSTLLAITKSEEKLETEPKCVITCNIFDDIQFDTVKQNQPIGDELWDEIKFLFVELQDEFDGICSAIVQNVGHGEFKGEYLKMKSLWSKKVKVAVNRGIPLLLSESLYLATWLFVCGCSIPFGKKDELALSIVTIIKTFNVDVVASEDFTSRMEDHGYRRPFSRLIALRLSQCESANDLFEVIRGFCTPISLNSFICSNDGDAFASFKSYIACEYEDLVSNDAKRCEISVCGSDVVKSLKACPLVMSSDNWTPYQYAESVYQKICVLLSGKPGHVVLGHVTSEQSIISMCTHSEDIESERKSRGMSIFVSEGNETTCGRGMYFFKMSKTGNFGELAGNGGDDVSVTTEFQGFLYALTRCFTTSEFCHYLSPAVLLFVVESNMITKNIVDVSNGDRSLPFVECACGRRYNEDCTVKSDGCAEPTACDGVFLLSTAYIKDDAIEKRNAVALRSGLVDFRNIGGYEANVTDGSKLQSTSFDTKLLKNYEITPKATKLKTFRIQKLNELYSSNIQHWRRPMLSFCYNGKFQFINQIRVSTNISNQWPPSISTCPKETVITSQLFLERLLEASDVSVAYLNPDVEFTQRPYHSASMVQQTPVFITFNSAKSRSQHLYYKILRDCKGNNCRLE
jgi:hypothetical protein